MNNNLTEVTLNGVLLFEYTYNANNRLVKVEGGNNTTIAEYYYDPFGRQLWKEVGGIRTYFFYSDEGLVAEYDVSGMEVRSYGYKPDSTWTTDPLFLKQNGQYYFYQNDHLGTPQKLMAQNGAVVWSAMYTAFGQVNVEIEAVTNNLRFPGQYFDVETGLHYNFQRYYDPGRGSYITTDPIGFAGGDMNWYGYTHNNPLHFLDPLGMGSLTEVESGAVYYTWHMGWIDYKHAFKHEFGGPLLKDAWKKIQNAHDNEPIPFPLKLAGVVASSEGQFCLQVAPKHPNATDPLILRKNQLLHAWMIISEQFEKAQGKWYLSWKWLVEIGGFALNDQIDKQPSGFSSEDLVSNLIFFYTVVDGRDKTQVDILAGKFDPWDEPDLSKAIWIFSNKTQPGHTSWMNPQYLDYDQFLQFPFTDDPWSRTGSSDPMLMLGAKAQQLLRKYYERWRKPDFPDEFEIYRPTSEGYVSIKGKNMLKKKYIDLLLPQVEYWQILP